MYIVKKRTQWKPATRYGTTKNQANILVMDAQIFFLAIKECCPTWKQTKLIGSMIKETAILRKL